VYKLELHLEGSERRLRNTQRLITGVLLLLVLPPLFGTIATVSASPNIGLLRVSDFLCPREVLPSSSFPVSLDVEYAIQSLPDKATIRGAVYDANQNSSPLWQSDPTLVSNGGDQIWNFTLNAPATEGFLNLIAYAYFLDNGTWTYFNNPVNGPGVSQRTVEIGETASLNVNLGAPNVAVTVGGSTEQTSPFGTATFSVPVSSEPSVTVPALVELQNSTRLIFVEWNDGITLPKRQVQMDGDMNMTAQYRIQYLLTLTNGSTVQEWYDRGANATLSAPTSGLAPWPLSAFGVTETFQGWRGDIDSSSPQVNITMDSPKTITADVATNYQPLVIPAILAAGIAATIISFVLVQASSRKSEEDVVETLAKQTAPETDPTCPECGEVTEPEWAHCIRCGAALEGADLPKSQVQS